MGCVGSRADRVEAEGRQFRIKRLVATGGFSQLFLAEDVDSGERVAVKKMVSHSRVDAARVRAEVGMLLRFGGHEHVLPMVAMAEHQFGEAATVFSLVFPFCRLGSLQDELAQRRPSSSYISQHRVLFLFRQICSAIQALHCSRPPVAHRDIKPANLMFRNERLLQLIDFGSATECPLRIESAQDSRKILDEAAELCTMPYRAPELFTCEIGSVIGEAVDIWSLGCVLFALCYLSSPFDQVHERGDSVALAVQSASLSFDKSAPFDQSLADLIISMVRLRAEDRPQISEISRRAEEMCL